MNFNLIHGTTKKNFELGIDAKETSIWNCSNDNYMYFWDVEKIHEYDEIEENRKYAIQSAIESACIQACINKDDMLTLIFKKYSLHDENIENDFSCNYMTYASTIDCDLLDNYETKVIHIENPIPETLRLFNIQFLLDNENTNYDVIEELDLKVLNMIKNIESCEISETIQDLISEAVNEVMEMI